MTRPTVCLPWRWPGALVVINDSIARALLALAGGVDETDAIREHAVIFLGPVLEHADMFQFEDPDDIVITEAVFPEKMAKTGKINKSPDIDWI
ncbi:MAG: hypothetical protein DSY90_11685 [Deltaproteobacteria bacterium]|nr:MAG: hypothetical protein DSY90_11685 [Deltaproteobacteria bacterium]